MTKADKIRRKQAQRREAEANKRFAWATQFSGVDIQSWTLVELHHEKLNVAAKLGFTIVLRHNGGQNWRVIAVKKPS